MERLQADRYLFILYLKGNAALGVTPIEPGVKTMIPRLAYGIEKVWIRHGYNTYTDGELTGDYPDIELLRGNTFGISLEPGNVIFYKNGEVHYDWKTEISDDKPVWGVVELGWLEKITVFSSGKQQTIASASVELFTG